jgi:hypothetical protein
VGSLASKAAVSRKVALYCLVFGLGNTVVLDRTTIEGRMNEDLQGLGKVRRWVEVDSKAWESVLLQFKAPILEQ